MRTTAIVLGSPEEFAIRCWENGPVQMPEPFYEESSPRLASGSVIRHILLERIQFVTEIVYPPLEQIAD